MTKIAVEDGTSVHTGTTVVGPVPGTLSVGTNSFCFIEGTLIVVEDGKLDIPTHLYQSIPPLSHSHSFSPDTFLQSFVTVEGLKAVLVGDSYSSDPTEVDGTGSNTFVEVS